MIIRVLGTHYSTKMSICFFCSPASIYWVNLNKRIQISLQLFPNLPYCRKSSKFVANLSKYLHKNWVQYKQELYQTLYQAERKVTLDSLYFFPVEMKVFLVTRRRIVDINIINKDIWRIMSCCSSEVDIRQVLPFLPLIHRIYFQTFIFLPFTPMRKSWCSLH